MSVSIRVSVDCYKCRREEDIGNVTTENGWHTPYYVMHPDSQLQTQLCPDCRGWSLYMWLRAHHRPRIFARIYAFLNGYFWLPCPVCRENFAGFEWGESTYYTDIRGGRGVCYKKSCNGIAEKRGNPFEAKLAEMDGKVTPESQKTGLE